jgi:hypothetical protein
MARGRHAVKDGNNDLDSNPGLTEIPANTEAS